MKDKLFFTQELETRERDAVKALEKYNNQSRGIFYKLDPQAFSREVSQGGQYGHFLYYMEDILKGYASLSCFDGESGECAVIIEKDNTVFDKILASVLARAEEKKLRSLLFIVDSNDEFLSGRIRVAGFKYSFSEYRMDFDVAKFKYSEDSLIPLQPAEDGDRDAVVYLENGNASWMDDADFANTKVAKRGGSVTGKIRIDNVDGTVGIYGFVVDPKLRGQGLGRKMLTSAVKEIIADGFEKLYLEVSAANSAALHLYESVGFGIRAKFDYYERMF